MTKKQKLRALLEEGVRKKVFPGAVAVVIEEKEILIREAVGNRSLIPCERPMRLGTLFDLASLTKPLITAPMTLLLAEEGRLDLDEPVIHVLPEWERSSITFRHLLTHTSGLPAWRPLFRELDDPRHLVRYVGKVPLENPPGKRIGYSCLGYLLLGKAIERLTGESLGSLARRRLLLPLDMNETGFSPSAERAFECAATESAESARRRLGFDPRPDRRGNVLWGTVHDENAYFVGGVAGNAGLFSTVDDLTRYAFCLLNRGVPIFSERVFTLLREAAVRDDETTRSHGWILLEDGSCFHTGFTGTSFRWDSERRRAAILLTNRVHPDASNNAIGEFRREFHRYIFDV